MAEDPWRRTWEARHARAPASEVPSPFVVAALDAVAGSHGTPATKPPRRALDVACGGGRHALLLATRGYRVVAMDFAAVAVRALRDRGRSRGFAVDGLVADVTAWPLLAGRFDVVVVVDFLERALLPVLRDAVIPGGALVMETFMVGQERCGHPRNPAYLLQAGELADACRGWTILAAYEGESHEDRPRSDPPPCRAGIVAIRPAIDSPPAFGSYPRR